MSISSQLSLTILPSGTHWSSPSFQPRQLDHIAYIGFSPSLCLGLSLGCKVSDKERLMYYHTAFDLKLAYLLNLFQLAF